MIRCYKDRLLLVVLINIFNVLEVVKELIPV